MCDAFVREETSYNSVLDYLLETNSSVEGTVLRRSEEYALWVLQQGYDQLSQQIGGNNEAVGGQLNVYRDRPR